MRQEGKTLRRKAGGYAHAKQFKRLRKTVKRQRTILGVVMREVQRKLDADKARGGRRRRPVHEASSPKALSDLATLMERAERIRTQQRNNKNKLYALHAPEVECISKGKARNPYEFGVKVSLVVTHKQGLMVGARSFPGNPYDGHVLSAQLEQTANLLQDTGRAPKQVIVDLGYRGVDADNPGVQIIHRGKYKSLSDHEKRLLKRRQAIEPLIGHTKADHRMDRCWLQGAVGDALHALSCAAGYNIRWLLRAIARLGLGGLFCALSAVVACALDHPPGNPDIAHGAETGRYARTSHDAGVQVGGAGDGQVNFACPTRKFWTTSSARPQWRPAPKTGADEPAGVAAASSSTCVGCASTCNSSRTRASSARRLPCCRPASKP